MPTKTGNWTPLRHFLVATPSPNFTACTIIAIAMKWNSYLKHVQPFNEATPLTNTAAMACLASGEVCVCVCVSTTWGWSSLTDGNIASSYP